VGAGAKRGDFSETVASTVPTSATEGATTRVVGLGKPGGSEFATQPPPLRSASRFSALSPVLSAGAIPLCVCGGGGGGRWRWGGGGSMRRLPHGLAAVCTASASDSRTFGARARRRRRHGLGQNHDSNETVKDHLQSTVG